MELGRDEGLLLGWIEGAPDGSELGTEDAVEDIAQAQYFKQLLEQLGEG